MNKQIFMPLSLAALLLASCGTAPDTSEGGDIAPAPEGYPPGTVEVSPGNFMIPLEQPVDGCKAYRNHAPGRMVAQVIYYQHPDGSFSPVREGAVCE